MLHEISLQILYADSNCTICLCFSVNTKKPRPSSVAVSTPSRLITLSEAQDRLHDHPAQQSEERSSSYNGEEGSDIIPVFHTVIDFE